LSGLEFLSPFPLLLLRSSSSSTLLYNKPWLLLLRLLTTCTLANALRTLRRAFTPFPTTTATKEARPSTFAMLPREDTRLTGPSRPSLSTTGAFALTARFLVVSPPSIRSIADPFPRPHSNQALCQPGALGSLRLRPHHLHALLNQRCVLRPFSLLLGQKERIRLFGEDEALTFSSSQLQSELAE
jgi:hypothetical protein